MAEDSVATQRIIELAEENEQLLVDVEEYRKNEDDLIAKIEGLQKYVVNFRAAQRQLEELNVSKKGLLAEKDEMEERLDELEDRLRREQTASKELSEKHQKEMEEAASAHSAAMAAQKQEYQDYFTRIEEEHNNALNGLQIALTESNGVETVREYFKRIECEIDDLALGSDLHMKDMRSCCFFEGIPWPPVFPTTELHQLPLPTLELNKKSPEGGFAKAMQMVTRAHSTAVPNELQVEDSTANPVVRIVESLREAQLNAAYYFFTLQRMANANSGGKGGVMGGGTSTSGSNTTTGTANSGSVYGAYSVGAASAKSGDTAKQASKGMKLWA